MKTSAPRSLVSRVVIATATVAAIAGLVGASLASLVAYYFLRRDEDARLTSAAEHAEYELVRDGAEGDRAILARLLTVEASEIENAGMVIGVIAADGSALGSYTGGPVRPGRCADKERKGKHFRACAAAWGSSIVVVASADESVERFRRLCVIAALLAAAFSVLAGVSVSRRVARSALSPLIRLHERVAGLPPMARGADLGEREGVLEVDALRSALDELLERQAKALDRSRNFAADAAHELRTPLTTLRAKVEILLEQQALEASQRDSMKSIQNEIARLARIVERLLVLAMPEEEALALAKPLPIADLVEEVIAGLPVDSRERVDLGPSETEQAVVRGDAALLELAVVNVIDNALKYSSGRVAVTVAMQGENVAIDVLDSGPGIPAHERTRLFQPFHRGAGVRHVRGHGIGLAIVAKVIDAHGGTVSLAGEQGLRVRMLLPRIKPAAPARSGGHS